MIEKQYGEPEVHDSVLSLSGSERLDLFFEPVEYVGKPSTRGANFHSLVFSKKQGSSWSEKLRIDRQKFQGSATNKRWISRVHSVDSSGKAVIMVAEGDAPPGSKRIDYIYSWREWDLIGNMELRNIRTCADPFERF